MKNINLLRSIVNTNKVQTGIGEALYDVKVYGEMRDDYRQRLPKITIDSLSAISDNPEEKNQMTNAYDELLQYLGPEEKVQAIVFGEGEFNYSVKSRDRTGRLASLVPMNIQGTVLTLEEARPYMLTWSFNNKYGSICVFPTYVWTDRRVIWVGEHDGKTWLDSIPITPTTLKPELKNGERH